MPLYFFHLTTSHDTPDDRGSEHDNIDAAKCHAVKMIADVLCETPHKYWETEVYRVTVSNETRLVLFTVEMVSMDAPSIKSR